MYNSGVLGISKKIIHKIDEALAICDELCQTVKHHTHEQIAISYILQNFTTVQEAYEHVFHYRLNKIIAKEMNKEPLKTLHKLLKNIQKRDLEKAKETVRKIRFSDHLCQISGSVKMIENK